MINQVRSWEDLLNLVDAVKAQLLVKGHHSYLYNIGSDISRILFNNGMPIVQTPFFLLHIPDRNTKLVECPEPNLDFNGPIRQMDKIFNTPMARMEDNTNITLAISTRLTEHFLYFSNDPDVLDHGNVFEGELDQLGHHNVAVSVRKDKYVIDQRYGVTSGGVVIVEDQSEQFMDFQEAMKFAQNAIKDYY